MSRASVGPVKKVSLTLSMETEFGMAVERYCHAKGVMNAVGVRELVILGLKRAGELPEWWDGIRYK